MRHRRLLLALLLRLLVAASCWDIDLTVTREASGAVGGEPFVGHPIITPGQDTVEWVRSFASFDELKLTVKERADQHSQDRLATIRQAIELVERFGEDLANMMHAEEPYEYEQPIPCPLGTYCREGARSPITVVNDYSTPQPCHDGFFCPRGSSTPEGSGPCPSGYYCPTEHSTTIPLAIPCPAGSHCPGVANTEPTPCDPGTYSSESGQSICRLCGVGEICPHSGMVAPLPCTAGFVCDSLGLSVPERECPSSFYCEEGTATSDPDHATLKGPILCGPGVYCLGGVAHNTTMDWIPTQEEGKYAPQICGEGYYCDAGSSLPHGSGPCSKGSYCPPGSAAPKLVPVGTFSSSEGAITPSLCLPGYYAPVEGSTECIRCSAGHSCEGYGTYEPRICAPGTYRSRFDAITCKLCPTGTFAPYSGSTDISQCLPCSDSRVCGVKGMSNLSSAESCDGGFHCSAGTDRTRQHNHKCPAGHVCGSNTNPDDQYGIACERGYYCQKGTSLAVGKKYKCKQSHYCALGTASPDALSTHCPRQTSTDPGAVSLYNCRVQSVDICDKQRIDPNNVFEDLLYHPYQFHKDGDVSSSREILALTKVLPGIASTSNIGSSPLPTWRNDTIELFRPCPTYGFFNGTTSLEEELAGGPILLIGRNFRNSSQLTCKFRVQARTGISSEPMVLAKGSFISSTRIECPMPLMSTLLRDNATGVDLAAIQLVIDASNDGQRFSGDERIIPYTSAHDIAVTSGRKSFAAPMASVVTYTLIHVNVHNTTDTSTGPNTIHAPSGDLESILAMDKSRCLKASTAEEGPRRREQGWYEQPFMRQAHLSFDWSHIPPDMVFDQHYKLAIYARPSRCDDARCNDQRVRIVPDVEESPCLQPLKLPDWFVDPSVDKHQVINMTLLALDDALIRVEVQIIDGLYLASSDAFLDTMTVHIEGPMRANSLSDDDILFNNGEKRWLSPFISWEEREVDAEYFFAARLTSQDTQAISPPLNMPPRWDALERGRLLLSMNTTHESTTPTVKDHPSQVAVTNRFWDHPFHTNKLAKEATDAFLETFHGVTTILQDDGGDGNDGTAYGYEMNDLVLPYLPFFSNCREFDSHVPIWALFESSLECALPEATDYDGDDHGQYSADWWRREFPALPHRDDMRAVGPSDFGTFYPIADWCERKLYCQYEEELGQTDVLPRWFEADTGTALFSVLRDPVNYYEFTGRMETYASEDDGGGQKHVHSIRSPDTFIPAKVDRTAALDLEEECTKLCFPRKLLLDVSYYQVDQNRKRIVEINLVYDDFDRNSESSEYELSARLRPLDYRELIIKFAYSRGIFCVLFVQIGLFTVAMAAVYWAVVRMTTQLESPPKLRFFRLWRLIFPPALTGFLMGLFPTAIMTISLTLLMRGHLASSLDIVGGIGDGHGKRIAAAWPVFKSVVAHYADAKIEPDDIEATVQGRTGLGFLAIAIACIYEGSKMFIPKIAAAASSTTADDACKDRDIKALTLWKRSNMIYTSVVMGLFLVLIVEWSYWRFFGNYIWEIIIFLKILSNFVGNVVDGQLGEALLSAPVMTAMGLVEGLVTLSANDFVDFLLSYIVGFGFLLLDRMYIGPLQGDLISWISNKSSKGGLRAKEWIGKHILGGKNDKNQEQGSGSIGVWNGSPPDNNRSGPAATTTNGSAEVAVNSQTTVEPIIDSYCAYCCDTLSLLYSPYIILLLIMFRDETEMPAIYGIKEQDMEYYIIFALLIIPFQIATDVLIHGCLELFHGWRIHDYLVYARYRFLQRETRWKGLEDSLDECIDESVRSLDQQCFSSQFYMMMTVHTNGIIYLVLGIEMMSRARYNLFGDPAMPLIIAFVFAMAVIVKKLLLWLGLCVGLWRVRKHRQQWHQLLKDAANLQNAALNGSDGEDEFPFEIQQRITSETFRHKFLDYNQSWLTDQLPSLLTPRTMRRSQGYLVPQFSRILRNLDTDISSDSSDDDGPKFDNTALDSDQRGILRTWVEHRMICREAVEPKIQAAMVRHCQRCLSQQHLSVKTSISFDDMYTSFKTCNDPGDQVAFKTVWQKMVAYETLCQRCVADDQGKRKEAEEDARGSFGAIEIGETANQMLMHWRDEARVRVGQIDISDDEGHDPSFEDSYEGDEASSYLARMWLRQARARTMRERVE